MILYFSDFKIDGVPVDGVRPRGFTWREFIGGPFSQGTGFLSVHAM
jgi:hypothetical protein